MDNIDPSPVDQPSAISKYIKHLSNIYQTYVDRAVPYVAARWIAVVILIIIYTIRIIILPGWYIVSYALGIYLLSLVLGFLTPKVDPALQQAYGDEDDDGPALPTKEQEEFRPFIRRLPEFKFWLSAMKALLLSLLATCFTFTDIPVFWPILVMYFCVLVFVTMKKQIRHMIKYKYIPFTRGKTVYQGKPDSDGSSGIGNEPIVNTATVHQPANLPYPLPQQTNVTIST